MYFLRKDYFGKDFLPFTWALPVSSHEIQQLFCSYSNHKVFAVFVEGVLFLVRFAKNNTLHVQLKMFDHGESGTYVC